MPHPLVAPAMRFLSKLSYPRLFAVTAALFAVNLVVPDMVPFVDEILLGLGALLLSRFRKRNGPDIIDPPR